ncbi:MAG: hypothetical protein KIT84_43270 [Labilithrix sp.]|nr:hypothetical protein [Labilithrix sp.]MCW5817899.1 hypothetical protein [Labilithrix sp.]
MTAPPTPTPTPPPLDDFHPPYHLGAFGCVVLGAWSDAPDERAGFEPLSWGRGYLGAALVLRYDRPPADYPVPYSEVILSYVMRRGARCAALPFDLVLDNPFYVEAGIRHYHLPKRLDPTLRIELDATRRITCAGSDLAFEAELGSVAVPGAKGIVSMLLRGFTGHVPILGAASRPFLRTIIRVSPEPATTYRARGAHVAARGRTLKPLAAFFWRSLAITVGAPAPL